MEKKKYILPTTEYALPESVMQGGMPGLGDLFDGSGGLYAPGRHGSANGGVDW